VLTADLVNARRRGNELHLTALDADGRARARALAAELLAAAKSYVGRSREDLEEAFASIDVGPREYRLKDGLAKLIEDRCAFEAGDGVDAADVRREVFTRASAVRAGLQAEDHFDRRAVLAAAAEVRGTSADALERALFSDLRGAQIVGAFEAPSPEALVAAYEYGQAQAVLLRAVQVRVDVRCASAAGLRDLFRKLKFLRLLHAASPSTWKGGAHRVVIDGPFSLFESSTKYGLQLAMILPVLDACDEWRLEAEVRWGKERTPLLFRLAGGEPRGGGEAPAMPGEVEALVRAFKALGTPWRVSTNTEILELPGVGLTVPDLVFERPYYGPPRDRVFLEVMGYWSRDAVWKRVELVQRGLSHRILFAVSSRLRVSEDVLGDDLPGVLYVYKQAMSARAVAERLDALAS
jgi:predicted nuclease of restriction endonuclease-like RecB superfamily